MKKTKAQLITEENRKEIFYNVVNSLIAGFISFFSALLAASEINYKVIGVAIITSLLVLFIRFKDYWDGEKGEYCKNILNFV